MSNIEYVDVIFGASYGDEGKGKIAANLAPLYDYVCRYNGGSNAGHTFYVDGKKVVTHIVPSGLPFGVKSIVGPNCVVNIEDLYQELAELSMSNFNSRFLKISPRAHIVTAEHKSVDAKEYSTKLGTTSKGIGPCYADKINRTGIRAESIVPNNMLWDEKLEGRVLCEGAQGFWLDINQGSYPYVTSSECLPYAACSLGFAPQKIRNIYAVAKMYDTRAGIDPYFDLDDEETQLVAKLGNEFGSTTGRPRKIKWLNLNKLKHVLRVSGTTHLILNKGDVLEKANIFKVYDENSNLIQYNTLDEMTDHVTGSIREEFPNIDIQLYFKP